LAEEGLTPQAPWFFAARCDRRPSAVCQFNSILKTLIFY
jgi:hypothetical protein